MDSNIIKQALEKGFDIIIRNNNKQSYYVWFNKGTGKNFKMYRGIAEKYEAALEKAWENVLLDNPSSESKNDN